MDEEDFFFGLGDDAAASAFVLATQTPLTLVELCHQAVVADGAAVFAALMRRQPNGEDDGPLLPVELAAEVVASVSERRQWTDELLEFALRRVYAGEVALSAQPRLARVAELLSDAHLTANLRSVHLSSLGLSTTRLLVLHGRQLLEELRLEKVIGAGLSLAECPRLRRIDIQSCAMALGIDRCTALESLELHGDLDLTCLSRVVSECPDLRRLRCSSRSSVPFEIGLEGREARLEELSIHSSKVAGIRLAGGCPRLAQLDLFNCAYLQLVHITGATALTDLRLESIALPAPRGHAAEPALVRIEDATSLTKVVCADVNALYMDSLERLSGAIQTIRLTYKPATGDAACLEPRAADVSRLLQRAGGRSPLRLLVALTLQLNDDIDGFELTDAAALPSLARLSLVGRTISNVTVALPSLRNIVLEARFWSMSHTDANSVRDGRVSLTSPAESSALQSLRLLGARVRELELDCPELDYLAISQSHVPAEVDLATALPALNMVEYGAYDYSDEEVQRLFGHVPNRYALRF